MNLAAFTLIRNGHKYDYPFLESLESLHELCGDVYIAVGESEDGTEQTIQSLDYCKITDTVWDESLRTGGLILSQQTNVALEALRAEMDSGWAFYLQGDEVLHQDDFELIKEDMKKAQEQGCDAISFRYFHFWLQYDQVAIRKNWYPQEIRAVRIDSDILSAGDAQSFKNVKKVYQSDATVYHYGHVRSPDKYKLKREDFHFWWHRDEDMEKVEREATSKSEGQRTLLFHGSHPKYMREKVETMGLVPQELEKVTFILDKEESLDKKFLQKVCAKQTSVCFHKSEVDKSSLIVDVRRKGLKSLYSPTPQKMKSKLARRWPLETYTMFELSRLGGWMR